MTILVIDAMNQLHRARSGFTLGPAPVAFNFFRSFRALIEQFEPTRVCFVLDGHPKKRYELLPEYKANRKVEQGTPEHTKLVEFHRQKDEVISMLSNFFPVSVIRHKDYECDDVVYSLIKRSSTVADWVVISNDSDFTQLLDEFQNVKVYNPINKSFVCKFPHNYVDWKALRGDASDNVPGLVSDADAYRMMNDPEKLTAFFNDNIVGDLFSRNHKLIKFMLVSDEEALDQTCSEPVRDWDAVKQRFDDWGFKSITKDGPWQKFVGTFDKLWVT